MSRYSLRIGHHPDGWWRWEICRDNGTPGWPTRWGEALTRRAALRRGGRALRQLQKIEARREHNHARYERFRWEP